MKRLVLAAAAALLSCAAAAQAPCPVSEDLTPRQLLGTWKAEVQGPWNSATLLLTPHPDYPESLRGTLLVAGARAEVAGDFEDGDFTLEESSDGVHIAATWLGALVDGSCGREIRGDWKRDGEADGHAFVLRRQ
jgi:opacity protein-like surface antigen